MAEEFGRQKYNPWQPITDPHDTARLGKFNEELGECAQATSRVQIQGLHELEPETGKPNKQALEEEIADVWATMEQVIAHFKLDMEVITRRVERKGRLLETWFEQIQ